MDITKIKLPNGELAYIKDAYARTTLLGKEDASNKVTTVSASSTDTQYPSAKAVYDFAKDAVTVEMGEEDTLVFTKLE